MVKEGKPLLVIWRQTNPPKAEFSNLPRTTSPKELVVYMQVKPHVPTQESHYESTSKRKSRLYHCISSEIVSATLASQCHYKGTANVSQRLYDFHDQVTTDQ